MFQVVPLFQDTSVDEAATWNIPATAPNRPGICLQEWQLMNGTDPVGQKVTVYLIVVPEEARQLKEDIDQQIEELRQTGEEEIEQFIDQLEQEAKDWVSQKLINSICKEQLMLLVFSISAVIFLHKKRQ